MTTAQISIWLIVALATAGVIIRPWRLPEAIWAVLGACLLVVSGLLPWHAALTAIGKGTDVYLFLIGMMLLAELARNEGLFDTLAGAAARYARGSASRLFGLIYLVGTVVTVFMSNDATAIVLTPAVCAVAKAAKVKDALPYLLICAFIANAASFVLPISNPANLVVFQHDMPPLASWLMRFTLPSVMSIVATFAVLRWTQRHSLRDAVASDIAVPALSGHGILAACGIAVTAVLLLLASAFDRSLGLPTFAAAALTAVLVLAVKRQSPLTTVSSISWPVIPLVAGLFVLVEGLNTTGLLPALVQLVNQSAGESLAITSGAVGIVVALVTNLANNLPVGLLTGVVVAGQPAAVSSAALIGVDLGPNLSVTGSLATILWLVVLRREGVELGAWRFLKLGALVMPPALLLALAALRFERQT